MDEEVNISLTKDEALVLFDFLWRFSETDKLEISHQAEERALWNLCCLFERELVEPFMKNYSQLLHDAQERLKDEEE